MQVTLSFSQCGNCSSCMLGGQAVIVENMLYYHGGSITNEDYADSLFNIHRYSIKLGGWLPTIRHTANIACGIGKIGGKLISIGGCNQNNVCNKLYYYKPDTGKWVDKKTPMPTARRIPTVISHPTCLIVAGGYTSVPADNQAKTNAVEIFSTIVGQWSQVDGLPIPCVHLSGGVSNDTVYMVGGADSVGRLKKTFVTSLDKLLAKTFSTPMTRDPSTKSKHEPAWSEATSTPAYWPSGLIISGMVLALGGAVSADFSDKQRVKDIYAYSPSMNSWIHVGELPVALSGACVVAISPVEFLVIGGIEDGGRTCTTTVYKGVAKLGFN